MVTLAGEYPESKWLVFKTNNRVWQLSIATLPRQAIYADLSCAARFMAYIVAANGAKFTRVPLPVVWAVPSSYSLHCKAGATIVAQSKQKTDSESIKV